MKIAIAQLNYTVGDIDGNSILVINSIERAKRAGADLVIFAEYAISGTPAWDLLKKTTFLELCEDALERIAMHCRGISAIVGSPIMGEKGPHSAAVLLQEGRVAEKVTKRNILARREMGFLIGGKGMRVINAAGVNVAVVVGDDFRHMQSMGDDCRMIININSRRYGKGCMTSRFRTIHDAAVLNSKTVVIVNQLGCGGEIVYDGTSGIMNSDGEIVLQMKSFDEDFVVFDTEAKHDSIDVPTALYSHDRTEMNFNAAVLGVRDYYHKNGYRKACVGLSGGIDSAIVMCIAAEALGKENVRGLIMPSDFTSSASLEDAKQVAENLGVRYEIIPISESYDSILRTLEPIIGGTDFDTTEENIQARIRTVLLMALQNKTGYMLLNCSNKSENALGLCTLYGDTAGAFSPTGDLYKTEMYELARYINRRYSNVIPESVMTKEPSSELRPNQKDSDTLPPYEMIDVILVRMIEQGQHREDIINAGFDAEVVEKIHSLVMNNAKKRFQFPPVLRLSSCAFGHELVTPLINRYPL